jgi:hypothetical protein
MNRDKYEILSILTNYSNKYKDINISDDIDNFIKEISIDFGVKKFYPGCNNLINYLLNVLGIELEYFFNNKYDNITSYINSEDAFKIYIKSNIDWKNKKSLKIYSCRISINDKLQDYYEKFYILQAILNCVLYFNKIQLNLLLIPYKNYDSLLAYIVNNILIPNQLFQEYISQNKKMDELTEIFNTNEEIIKLKYEENNLIVR